jgi:PAS domain S-box-containing protein
MSCNYSDKTKDELIAEIHFLHKQLDEYRKKTDEQARIECSLRESEEKFRSLVDNLPDTIMLFDDKLRHLYVSPNVEEQSGLSVEQFIGKTHKELGFPEHLVNMWEDALADVFDTGMPNRIEFQLPRGIWIDWLIIPLFNKEGRALYVITSARDITERKNTEAALKQSEQAVQALLNATTDAVFLVEISGKVLAANESLASRFHKKVKDLVGTVIDVLLPPEVLKKRREQVDQVAMTGQPVKFEDFRSGIWLENTFYPIADSNDQVYGIAVFSRDITERKIAEETLSSYAQMLEQRLVALTQPIGDTSTLIFSDVFNIEEIQAIQEAFSLATGTASVIADMNGQFITSPSNFSRLCGSMVRSTEKGRADCIYAVALTGKMAVASPHIETCQVCGLLHGSATITVGEHPVAIWHVGQICENMPGDDEIEKFAGIIGISVDEYRSALSEVPLMRREHFENICNALFLIARQVSILAVQNVQQAREITKRQKTEEALKESEERYRKLFKDNPLPAVVFDRETLAIVDANDAATEQYGYAREEFLTMTVKDLRPPDEIPALLKGVAMSAENVNKVPFYKHRKKDGTVFDVIVSAHDLDFMNKPLRLVLFMDITERKKTEEQLRLTQFSVEHSALPTFWLTTAGKPFRVNRAACTSLGYSEEELLSSNVHDWDSYFPYSRWDEISEFLKEKRALTTESVHTRKDGTVFPVDLTLNYLEFDGKEHLFAFARDVSERKEAEEEKQKLQSQILQTQKMETVGQLAAGIAHDFNNILTAIIGYGHLLQMTTTKETTTGHYAEQILLSAEKAAQLTQSLLAFSRKQTINPKPRDLKQIIKNMEKLLSRLLTEDIEFVTSVPDETLTVMADVTQIDQVLINLSTNARDAMPEGGKLHIIVNSVYLNDLFIRTHGYGVPGKYVLLTVSDTGVGMDKETAGRIFDPFYTTKEVGKGTGLGLSIVYGIIKQHNGFITVYSEPGHGTTFNIYFPLIQTEVHEEQVLSPQAVKGTETILVAEDNESVLNLTSLILKEAGYTVLIAVDGLDAIQRFKENADRIDLLIVDVVMPGKNGKEVYEEVKAIKSDVKVLFASGYTRDILVSKGVHDDDFNFIAKPVSPTELLIKLRELLDK